MHAILGTLAPAHAQPIIFVPRVHMLGSRILGCSTRSRLFPVVQFMTKEHLIADFRIQNTGALGIFPQPFIPSTMGTK